MWLPASSEYASRGACMPVWEQELLCTVHPEASVHPQGPEATGYQQQWLALFAIAGCWSVQLFLGAHHLCRVPQAYQAFFATNNRTSSTAPVNGASPADA